MGFPLTVRVLKALANQIELKRAGESSKLTEAGPPGKRWWRGFRGRHPELSLRSPDYLDRAMFATERVVFEYFLLLDHVLTRANAKNNNPHLIYYADETGVDLSTKVRKSSCRAVPNGHLLVTLGVEIMSLKTYGISMESKRITRRAARERLSGHTIFAENLPFTRLAVRKLRRCAYNYVSLMTAVIRDY
ncbi:hypothetical protein Bbelb_378540 [Branchiostoma belcheri]|nr:hypothetical protein Bbelb_378540 [Branchiostoma belcheri]